MRFETFGNFWVTIVSLLYAQANNIEEQIPFADGTPAPVRGKK